MADFIFPASTSLQAVARELAPRLEAARPVFEFFPIRNVDDYILQWEQLDNYIGLQQVRGLNGDPTRVKPVGAKRYLMEPGVYGEFSLIDERQLTTRRPYGTFAGGPVDITDLVLDKQNQLLVRRLDRIEYICWTLLATGTFSVALNSSVLHTDSYTTQTYNATTWGTVTTATPLADFRAAQLQSRGYSVDFGAGSKAYMNRTTFNKLLSNTNAADLGGRRVTGLQTVNGPDALNQVMAADDLPGIVIYDRGYIDDSSNFQLFVPNDVVIIIGARTDGDPVGEYRMVRNVNNPDMAPGAYMKVMDRTDRVPRQIEVHDGHNGGPVLFHPAAILVMDVS